MVRWLANILVAVCIVIPATAQTQESQHPSVINLMLLAERMDVNQLKDFAVQYDAKINPVFYTNAYLMMIRVRQGAEASSIDVVSTQLHNQNALQNFYGLEPLNHDLLPNLKQIEYAQVFTQDPNNKYTVPILGGTMCLLVNKSLLDPREITSYSDLWRPELKVLIPEDMGTLMQLTMMVMDCEPKDTSKALLAAAWEKMCVLAENSALVTNNALEFLVEDNDIGLALVYSPDAVEILKQNPNLVMVNPAEGHLVWIEALSIPANARNPELAHAYINYILQPEVLADLCKDTGYIPLSDQAYNMIKQQNGQINMLSPAQLLQSKNLISKIPLDEQYQVRWHNFVEDKQFLN